MTILPLPDQQIEFRNETLREEKRSPALLLDNEYPRSREILSMCAWCKKVQAGEQWLETDEAVRQLKLFDQPDLPKISHGICPRCNIKLNDQLGKLENI